MAADKKLEAKISSAVATAVADPTVPAQPAAIPAIVSAVVTLVPEILNATNKEAFYQSRIFWSQILALVSAILMLFGVSFTADTQSQILSVLMPMIPLGFSIGYALYGRFFAKKPLGQ
ncbi:MAG: hypothetical protein PW791_09305 [Neorhizobium sp.]|nr:hypothetical protein [Neorhizobium sp.]